jgi:hypothetical protein
MPARPPPRPLGLGSAPIPLFPFLPDCAIRHLYIIRASDNTHHIIVVQSCYTHAMCYIVSNCFTAKLVATKCTYVADGTWGVHASKCALSNFSPGVGCLTCIVLILHHL